MADSAEALVADAIARVKEADQAAEEAKLAFATGRFAEFWRRQGAAAVARVEKLYGECTNASAGSGGTSG